MAENIFDFALKKAGKINEAHKVDFSKYTYEQLWDLYDLLEDNPEEFKKKVVPTDGKQLTDIELPEVHLALTDEIDKYLQGNDILEPTEEEIDSWMAEREIGEPVEGGIRKGFEADKWNWYIYDLEELEDFRRMPVEKFKIKFGVEDAPLNDLEYQVALSELNKVIEEYTSITNESKRRFFKARIIRERKNK